MNYTDENNTFYDITQKDIDRVPCARIFGNATDKYIQSACKKVLEISMKRHNNRNDEVGLLIDLNGKTILSLVGYNGVIDITSDDYFEATTKCAQLSLVMVHNHPNNSTISYNDIQIFLTSPELIVLVAVSNNGTVHYLVKNKDSYTKYFKLAQNMAHALKTSKNDKEKIAYKILDKSIMFGLRYSVSKKRGHVNG